MAYTGRKVIYCDYEEITPQNILQVLTDALATHNYNRTEINYLYNYYKGDHPILRRQKQYRKEINNKIVENRANEIVTFKTGYLMGEPVQYVNRGQDDQNDAILMLNDYMFAEDKASKDQQLADWFHICGTSYRMILPDPAGEMDEAPFELYTLDPRDTFVVYYSGLGNRPLLGVKLVKQQNGTTVYSCYTRNMYIETESLDALTGGKIVKVEERFYGDIPIIEYPANQARLGAFEICLSLLDAIDLTDSNRLDGIEQYIQSVFVMKGVNFDDQEDVFAALRESGGLLLPDGGDAFYIAQELNQTQTQTLKNDLYQTVLTICGMPNRNGGSSTSDTGSAVILRDGWGAAESCAKVTEQQFKLSEKQFLRLALNIINTYRNTNLRLSAVDIRFTRRNYENIQTKAQVLTTMLGSGMIHPRLAFDHCGMFADSALAYEISMQWMKEQEKKAQEAYEAIAGRATEEAENQSEPEDEDVTDDV